MNGVHSDGFVEERSGWSARRWVVVAAVTVGLVVSLAVGVEQAGAVPRWDCKGLTRFVPWGCQTAKAGHQIGSIAADGTGIVVEGAAAYRQGAAAVADVAASASAFTEVGRARAEAWRDEQLARQATATTVGRAVWLLSPGGGLCDVESSVCVKPTTTTTTTSRPTAGRVCFARQDGLTICRRA